jgi:hypothetical protein
MVGLHCWSSKWVFPSGGGVDFSSGFYHHDATLLSVLATPFLWSKGKEMAVKSDVVNGEKDEVS